ncbi:polysaccharide pyruvyl transferase family protein [Synechococcus sp. CS-1332]|uniref:polysaccharide pyruvyl transferase family protein n=1 Tax=Synechococcus sp. CS-1332 TaxID=2847972 RepID=UPI00223ADE5A|nr:polysaccharide pyruvyl transferase family protein [Synechococcus sp. CS-1332]MCT0208463.1 polysaccharide pyruvyl transferase family protein [Synechococcus sp. CS-1332]
MNPDAILFGAFERHNFGDLLMGFAFERLLRQKGINAIHASILDNDLTACGGTKVHSIFSLLTNGLDPTIPILHVGGETASCSFNDALACDSPAALPYHLKDIISSEVHQELGTDRPFPYLTPPKERITRASKLWGHRLFYGIGLTQLSDDRSHNESLRATLAAASMVSFRDAHSLSNARSLGIDQATYAPDIVLSISRLMPVVRPVKPRYLLMHFNGNYLRRNSAALIDALSQIAPQFEGGLKIGLAGTANYHDSLDEFYRFRQLAKASSVFIDVLPSVDILTICQQIANAAAVVSTSLHYRIVARSYGVPRLTMNVHKVNCWSDSNDATHPYGIEAGELAMAINAVMQLGSGAEDSGQTKDLAIIDNHIETIAGIIHTAVPNPERPGLSNSTPLPPAPSPDLWIASMVRCLDNRETAIRSQAEIIRGQDAVLSSKARLLRRLLKLLMAAVLPKRLSAASSTSGAERHVQEVPEGSHGVGDPHDPIHPQGGVQRMES